MSDATENVPPVLVIRTSNDPLVPGAAVTIGASITRSARHGTPIPKANAQAIGKARAARRCSRRIGLESARRWQEMRMVFLSFMDVALCKKTGALG